MQVKVWEKSVGFDSRACTLPESILFRSENLPFSTDSGIEMLGARKHIHQRGRCRFKSGSIFPAKQAAEVAEPVLSSAKIGLFGSVSSSAVIRFLGRFVRVSTADRIYMWRIAQLVKRQIVDLQDSGSEPDSPLSRREQGTLSDDMCVTSRTALLHFFWRDVREVYGGGLLDR